MKISKRSHIINYLIKKRKYKKYLEIGIRDPSFNFDRIKCEQKDGVDPFPRKPCKYIMTSDEFFRNIPDDLKYDIIFIDGLHLCNQVLKDVNNSLNHLEKNGIIILHDCNPLSENAQNESMAGKIKWNGTVWKAFALLRMTRDDLNMYVVNIDRGCGIIEMGKQVLFKKTKEKDLTYDFLDMCRKDLLNLCSVEKFKKKIENII